MNDLPLILLARLAVDRRFLGKGLGHALVSEAFKIALRVALSHRTIFNAPNGKDAFAASVGEAQNAATRDARFLSYRSGIAGGGGIWTTFSPQTF
jgi:GNAT superfamily N-acetyltransferase